MARLPQTKKYHMCSDGSVYTDLDEAFEQQDRIDHRRRMIPTLRECIRIYGFFDGIYQWIYAHTH